MSAGALVDYALLPREYRIRRALRIALGLFVAALLLLLIHYWWVFCWPSIKAERIRMRWEQECLSHWSPIDTISYSNDPQDVQSFKASGCFTSGPNWRCKPYGMRQIPEFEKLDHRSVLPALFLHGRNAPGGPQRLVIIQIGRLPDDPFNRITLSPVNHQPLGTRGTTPSSSIGLLEVYLKPDDTIRLYEGQPDGSDASHFTIDYDLNGMRGRIDGKLATSGTITLTPQTGRVIVSGTTGFWSPTGAPMPGGLVTIGNATTISPAR